MEQKRAEIIIPIVARAAVWVVPGFAAGLAARVDARVDAGADAIRVGTSVDFETVDKFWSEFKADFK